VTRFGLTNTSGKKGPRDQFPRDSGEPECTAPFRGRANNLLLARRRPTRDRRASGILAPSASQPSAEESHPAVDVLATQNGIIALIDRLGTIADEAIRQAGVMPSISVAMQVTRWACW